ncbi:hypothetical protein [Pseudomonas sp. R37(2017)]
MLREPDLYRSPRGRKPRCGTCPINQILGYLCSLG